MKTVALLLDDGKNLYQQILSRQAAASAEKHQVRILPAEYAEGSSWSQLESINGHLRGADLPDALLILVAGEHFTRAAFERVVKKGVALVFLNRIPEWTAGLRKDFPGTLIAGVAPNQLGIGQIQARQALRLGRPGAFVILVTGAAGSVSAVERTRGFLETVKDRLSVHCIDGRWTESGARDALSEWFRIGAERERPVDLVVCQNDAMAAGVGSLLTEQAESLGRGELGSVPVIGCDGLEDEGQAMVSRGRIAATVVMPVTTSAALATLRRYWDAGERPGDTVLLDATSFPPLETLGGR